MELKETTRIKKILSILYNAYPAVKTQLKHRTPFELLVATILSAQCTDRQVNSVTGELFRRCPTPHRMAKASLTDLETLVHSTGFYKNKARHIKNCAGTIENRFGGEVPRTMDELLTLPGVGRKTANLVLSVAFGIPGIVVDTHVARLSRRLGLSAHKDPAKIEADLAAKIPKESWEDLCLRLIYHGRAVCTARRPGCPACPLRTVCPGGREVKGPKSKVQDRRMKSI
jgi:endonuclease-3